MDAVKMWRRYLLGAHFEAWTDHEPLPGAKNVIADTLSRAPFARTQAGVTQVAAGDVTTQEYPPPQATLEEGGMQIQNSGYCATFCS